MKLSAEQITCIEALLALRSKGVTNTEIAKRLRLERFGAQKVSCAFILLDAMGLPVKGTKRGRPRGVKNVKAKQPAVARTFLSAAQWQERLAQMGH